jgi:hypothetical protein
MMSASDKDGVFSRPDQSGDAVHEKRFFRFELADGRVVVKTLRPRARLSLAPVESEDRVQNRPSGS